MLTLLFGIVQLFLNLFFTYKIEMAKTETEKLRIQAQMQETIAQVKGEVLKKGAWKYQVFLVLPVAVYFGSVVFYSMFFCQACILPYAGLGYSWSIAALPEPFMTFMAWIVAFLFVTGGKV